MLLTALAHTVGQFAPLSPEESTVVNAMRGHRIDLGLGMRPSFFDIFRDLSFTMGLLQAALALINLVIAAAAEVSGTLLKRITWLNVIWVAGFTAVGLGFRVSPPVISGLVILGFLVASLAGQMRR
jgi:hypothetical protein